MLRVMIVDDHDVVRDGLRALLTSAEMAVVAEASTAEEAVTEAVRAKPDVIVMDVRLADGSGIEATRDILSQVPDTRVIMLTSFSDEEAMLASVLAGASGYVLKEVRGGEIVDAIQRAAAGGSIFSDIGAEAVAERVRTGKHLRGDRLALLSPQEERILTEIARGRTNREIALELGLAEKTVKNYVSNVLTKLDVTRRAEAAAYLARHARASG